MNHASDAWFSLYKKLAQAGYFGIRGLCEPLLMRLQRRVQNRRHGGQRTELILVPA